MSLFFVFLLHIIKWNGSANMIILYFLVIPVICIIVKLILNLIVKKYGKFSYDGFSAAGFAYNPEKDIFYSTKNTWQKNFGYTHMYDVLAPFLEW